MFARFDENPAMTLRVIKETKHYGRTDARTDGQRENSIPPTVYPLQTKFAGGIITRSCSYGTLGLILGMVKAIPKCHWRCGTQLFLGYHPEILIN